MPYRNTVVGILPLPGLARFYGRHGYEAQGPDVYMVQLSLSLHGRLDAQALRQAGDALLARHGNLRTGFVQEQLEHPVAIVLPPGAAPWRSIDVSGEEESAREERLAAIAQRMSVLGTRFSQNLLADEQAFVMVLEDETDLAGLPESVRAAA